MQTRPPGRWLQQGKAGTAYKRGAAGQNPHPPPKLQKQSTAGIFAVFKTPPIRACSGASLALRRRAVLRGNNARCGAQHKAKWLLAGPKRKTPVSRAPTGADGGRDAHAVGLRKEEKFVSSAMRASDCSQVDRDWLPGECLRCSSPCRLNLRQAARKWNFAIKNRTPIAIFLRFDILRSCPASRSASHGVMRRTGLFKPVRVFRHFLQKIPQVLEIPTNYWQNVRRKLKSGVMVLT